MDNRIRTLAQARRVSAVAELNQLNTPAEARLDRVTQLARNIFGTSSAVISLVGESETWAKSVVGMTDRSAPNTVSFCSRCVDSKDGLVVEDAALDPAFQQNPFVRKGARLRFYAGVPLSSPGGEHVGALCVIDQRPRRWSERDQRILLDLARWAESELTLCQLSITQQALLAEVDTLRRKALLDPLTGCWNRHALSELFERELQRSRGLAMTLMLVDLDCFKRVNDHHGHPVGDHCLVETAHRIRAAIRAEDAMVRYGGDEFVLMLGNCDGLEGRRLAERMCRDLADGPLQTPVGPMALSLSIGMVTVRLLPDQGLDGLINRADEALLRAKHAGRNRVEVADDARKGRQPAAPIPLRPVMTPG